MHSITTTEASDDDIAENYYISGEPGEPKRIELEKNSVMRKPPVRHVL